ncbi:uncharacterized protein METZ01_LOCUS374023, partial [marine metagenome]
RARIGVVGRPISLFAQKLNRNLPSGRDVVFIYWL